MGVFAEIRKFDLFSSAQSFKRNRARFLSLELGNQPITVDEDVTTVANPDVRVQREILERFVEAGDDEGAHGQILKMWEGDQPMTLLECLGRLKYHKAVLGVLSKHFTTLTSSPDRRLRYQTLLSELKPIDLSATLRNEACIHTHNIRSKPWRGRATSSRIFEAWAMLHESTDGFEAPAQEIVDSMRRIADKPGYSWVFVQILFPVHAQTIEVIAKVDADRQRMVAQLASA